MKAGNVVRSLHESLIAGLDAFKGPVQAAVFVYDEYSNESLVVDHHGIQTSVCGSPQARIDVNFIAQFVRLAQSDDIICSHLKTGSVSQLWVVRNSVGCHSGPIKEWLAEAALTSSQFVIEGRLIHRQFAAKERIKNY